MGRSPQILIAASLIGAAYAFTSAPFLRDPPSAFKATPMSPARMAAEEEAAAAPPSSNVPILISGNNVEVTPAMMDYVNKKLEKVLGKLSSSGAIRECDVHLSVNKNPKVKDSHSAEVVTSLKGTTIRCLESTPDMYTSIDFVSERLARKLRQYKERRLQGYHGGPHMGTNLADVLNELPIPETEIELDAAEFVDPDEPKVTKIKSFDLSKPISLKEAIFALDYIDHDFYVFRDEESDEVSVVYKRNAGGVGLIQPSN